MLNSFACDQRGKRKEVEAMRRISLLISILALLGIIMPTALSAVPSLDRYIVVLHDHVQSPEAIGREIAQQAGGRLGYVYEYAIKGFSIQVPEQALEGIQRNPNVNYVATDDVRWAFGQDVPTGIQRIYAEGNQNISINGIDDFRVDVDVAVIDTGIDFEHPDLNVVGGINCAAGNIFRAKCIQGGDDDHYHGTHVAGTIGALDSGNGVVGVAPGARLWAVKVLNSQGSGYTSWIIAGIDWVAQRHDQIEVANMSLGGSGYNKAEYDAIQGAVTKGVAFAVAAGNNDADAKNYSPAAFDNVLTVSALADFDGKPGGLGSPTCRSDQDDTLADFSNWGSAIDIAAPGVCILSTFPLEKGEYGTISGTSMASPHGAGALALLASGSNKPKNELDVYHLYDLVRNSGNYNWTDDSGDGVQEPLLDVSTFVPFLIESGGNTNTAPVVQISQPSDLSTFESGTTIVFAGSALDDIDGNLTDSLTWVSTIDEKIGQGGSLSSLLSDGTHTITASATDTGGLIGTASITVTVVQSNSEDITLSVVAYKIKGERKADLTWSGATSAPVDVYRNGIIVASTNDETYTDSFGRGGGSATYKVCDSSTCSNEVTVSW
jgi:subtilisin